MTARYSDLVDRKFSIGLTSAEERELATLEERLDVKEADFYEPVKRRLRATLGNV